MTRLIFLAILFGFTLLLSCGEDKEQPTLTLAKGGRYYGGTLRLTKAEPPRTLYPPSLSDPISARLASQIYEGLFRFDPVTLAVLPALAERFESNPDSTQFIFHLRKGILFHDDPCFKQGKGRELTATDVQYCLARLCTQSPENLGYVLFKDMLEGADAYFKASAGKAALPVAPSGLVVLDQHRLQITLTRPFPALPRQLARPQALIYPREAVRKYGTIRLKAVGTGPFILADLEKDISMRLERNKRYYRQDVFGNALPLLDGINIQFIPDKRTELSEYQSNGSHLLYRMPPEMFVQVLGIESDAPDEEWRNTVLMHQPEMITHYLTFNFRKSFFNSLALRRAIAQSIDKNVLLGTVLNGEGFSTADHGLTSPHLKDYPSSQLKGLPESVDSARAWLEKAPVPSEKLKLAFYPDGSRNTLIAVAILQQLKQAVGIEVTLEPHPLPRLYDNLLSGQFDMVLLPMIPEYPAPGNVLEPFATKNTITVNGQTFPNFMRYSNPRFDRLYERAVSAGNETDAFAAYMQAEQLLLDEAAVIPLWYNEGYYLLKNTVRNFAINPLAHRDFTEVYFVPEKPKRDK